MNVRTFLLGALCGAVVFSILDRLMEERERRLAVREADSPAAEVRSEARTPELQPAVTAAPTPGTAEQPATSAGATASEEPEIEEPRAGERGSSAQLPPAATEASEVQGDAKDSGSGANESSDEEASAAVARADDETWGPFMEQALRQFLASHRSAAQFDIQSIRCASGVCEIRAIGFDQSTEPVWQQIVYDIRQQPWAEIGQAGTTGDLNEGRFVATAKLFRRPRT